MPKNSNDTSDSASGRETPSERAMAGALYQMERMLRSVADLNMQHSASNIRNHDTEIPKSMLSELEPWNPDDLNSISVAAFFMIFEDIAQPLDQAMKLRLLRAKTRGAAKQFLIDNAHLCSSANPFDEVRAAMLSWFEGTNPEKSAELLWTAKRQPNETLRHFVERLQRLAQSAVKDEGKILSVDQRRDWINRRVLKAFVKGVSKELSSHLISIAPATIKIALQRAESLEETLKDHEDVDVQWDIAAVGTSEAKRCYHCNGLNHFAASCPQQIPAYQMMPRRGKVDAVRDHPRPQPRFPCLFCGDLTHFPVDCPYNIPKAIFCDFCGSREHLERDCSAKRALDPVSHPIHTKERERRNAQINGVTVEEVPPNTEAAVALVGPIPIVQQTIGSPLKMSVTLNGTPRDLILDTGAAVSALTTPVPGSPIYPTRAVAWGPDGSPLQFRGEQNLIVGIQGTQVTHTFLIFANIGSGLDLLGLDLLRKFPIHIRADKNEAIIVDRSNWNIATVGTTEIPVFDPSRPPPTIPCYLKENWKTQLIRKAEQVVASHENTSNQWRKVKSRKHKRAPPSNWRTEGRQSTSKNLQGITIPTVKDYLRGATLGSFSADSTTQFTKPTVAFMNVPTSIAWKQRSKRINQRRTPRRYEVGDWVYLRAMQVPPGECKKFWSPWTGPWVITNRLSDVTYSIQDNVRKKQQTVHINRLKPAASHGIPDDSFIHDSNSDPPRSLQPKLIPHGPVLTPNLEEVVQNQHEEHSDSDTETDFDSSTEDNAANVLPTVENIGPECENNYPLRKPSHYILEGTHNKLLDDSSLGTPDSPNTAAQGTNADSILPVAPPFGLTPRDDAEEKTISDHNKIIPIHPASSSSISPPKDETPYFLRPRTKQNYAQMHRRGVVLEK